MGICNKRAKSKAGSFTIKSVIKCFGFNSRGFYFSLGCDFLFNLITSLFSHVYMIKKSSNLRHMLIEK